MLKLFASLELRLHPVRLLSAARPFLGGIFWVLIFREDLRIGTTRPIGATRVYGPFNAAQPFFKLGLLFFYFASQNRSYLFVQTPQLINRTGFESFAFHEGAFPCFPCVGNIIVGSDSEQYYTGVYVSLTASDFSASAGYGAAGAAA